MLVEHRMASLDELPNILPKNDPCKRATLTYNIARIHYNSRVAYSFFAWDHTVEGAPKRDTSAEMLT